jgi:hypothetical protein
LRAWLRLSVAARGALAASLVAVLGVGLPAACQQPAPSSAPSLGTAASTGTASAASSASSTPDAAPPAGTVTVDPSLLSILPSEIAGVQMQPAPEDAADIANDPSLAADVEAIAVAAAFPPGASGDVDVVVASVVRLRPDVFDETFFRDWRDTYDAAACEQAGGLGGNSEAGIDGRTVFIGSCVGGAFTYHLRYGEDVIVSITAVGAGRFGEFVVKNLGS